MTTILIDMVGKRYEKQRWALRDFSLRMDAGVWGLVGPNGAGKTTLLRILATVLTPTQGNVTWKGQDVLRHPRPLRREMGYLPQDFGTYPQLSAREFLRYIGELKGLSGSLLRHRVEGVLEQVHLKNDANCRLRTFSGGMIRRIGIAQALLNEPQFLLLDEPTVGLDPTERIYFRELIASLQGERLIILSTHIISDIEAMASNIALLHAGRLLWTGTPMTLQNDAEQTTWTVTLNTEEFERLRTIYQVSMAIRHGEQIETRFVTSQRPHPNAILDRSTLEEAYLYMVSQAAEVSPQLAASQ